MEIESLLVKKTQDRELAKVNYEWTNWYYYPSPQNRNPPFFFMCICVFIYEFLNFSYCQKSRHVDLVLTFNFHSIFIENNWGD